ncbi:hypothetical protein SNEBB_001541 [Seison nebaliae]|nr:hypothetical protein SNEBB_001541 [Seison nebaliae]
MLSRNREMIIIKVDCFVEDQMFSHQLYFLFFRLSEFFIYRNKMSFSEMNEEENASNAPATSLAPTSTLEVGDNCTNGDNTIENDDMMNEVDELIKNTKKDIGMERNGDMNIDEELEKTTKLIPNGDVSHNNDNVIEFGDAMNEKQERSSRELDDDDDEELMKEEDECDDITNDTARYEEDVSQTDDPPHSMDHTADLHTQSNKQAVISIENRDEKDGQMNIENEDNSSNSQETATVNTADTAIRGIDSIEITGNEELLAEKEIIDEIDNQNTTAEISTRIDGNFSLGNNDDKEEITTSELNSEELDIRSGSLQQTFSTHSLSNGLEGMMLSDDGIPLELLNDNGDNNENEQNIEERVNVTEADINYDNNPPINRVENIINTNNLLGSMETEELIGTNMALNPDVMMEHIELNRPYIQVGDNVINQVEYGNDGDRCSSFNISGDGIETFTIDSTTAPTDNTDQIMNNDLHDSFNETSTTPSISDDVLQSSDDTSSTQPDNDNDNVTDLSLDETNENKQDMKLSEEKLSRQIVQLIDNNSQNVIDVNEEFENENNHNASPMVLFPKTDEKLENELKDSTQIQVDDKPNVEIISLHDSDSSPSKTVSDKLDHIQNGDHLDEIDSSEELQIVYKSEKIEAHNEMTRGMEENGDSSEKSEEHVEEKIEVIENSEAINGKFENVGKLTERSEDVEKLTDHSEDVEKLTKQSEDVEKLENSLNSQELETYKKSDEKVVDVNMLSYEAERDNIDVIVTENKNEIDEEIKKESEPKCTLMSLSSDEKARNNSVEILDISNDSAPVVVSMTNEEKRNETIDGEGDEKENKKMDKSTGVRRTTSPKIEWKRNLLECKEEKNDSINPNDLTNTEMAEGPVPEHQKASIAPELKVENDNEEETVDDISEKKKEETTSGLVTVIVRFVNGFFRKKPKTKQPISQ